MTLLVLAAYAVFTWSLGRNLCLNFSCEGRHLYFPSRHCLTSFTQVSFYDILETPHLPKFPYIPRLKKRFLLRTENREFWETAKWQITILTLVFPWASPPSCGMLNTLREEKVVRIFWLINILFFSNPVVSCWISRAMSFHLLYFTRRLSVL